MSKGSTRRPTEVPEDEKARRWEKTFGPQRTDYEVAVFTAEEPTERFMWDVRSIRHVRDR